MKTRLIGFSVCIFIITIALGVVEAALQNPVPLTNDDIISLKRAAIGDEVIILKISSGPTQFSTEAADLIALKNAGISDAVIAAMLKSSASQSAPKAPNNPSETKKTTGPEGTVATPDQTPNDIQARQKVMERGFGSRKEQAPLPSSMEELARWCDQGRVDRATGRVDTTTAQADTATARVGTRRDVRRFPNIEDEIKALDDEIKALKDSNKALEDGTKVVDEQIRCFYYLGDLLNSIRDARKIAEDTGTPKGTTIVRTGGFLRLLQMPEELICLPDTPITGGQAAKIFEKWAGDHPQWLQEPARVHVLASLLAAFPCKEVRP